jgi:signal transduction histidine kinase
LRSSEGIGGAAGRIGTSIAFRLAVMLGGLFAIGLIAFGGLVYVMTSRELTARSDQILQQEARFLLAQPAERLPLAIRGEIERNIHGLLYFALIAPDGEVVEGNIPAFARLKPGQAVDVESGGRHGPMRLTAVVASTGETILLGRDTSEIHDLLRRLLLGMLLSCLSIITAGLLISGFLSHGLLARVHDLQMVSRRIALGHFEMRIATTGRGDEVDQIATSINAMVEDIERILSQVKTVTDTIAHDLRTPLTRVRNRLEEARAAGTMLRGEGSIDDLIGDLGVVLDRFAALLRIAELEATERRAGFGTVRVADLLGTVCELYAPLAEDDGFLLDLHADTTLELQGDGSLLLEAISNLVDNAIKFARSRVWIDARMVAGCLTITVKDDGPGISEEECEAVLRRFYRAGGGAQRPGFGLGLNIVSAILHMHHFTLDLRPGRPGLVTTITVPRDL